MGHKSRERRQRRQNQRSAIQRTLGTAADSASGRTLRLWHVTTTAIVPPTPEPFELLPPSVHGARPVWDDSVAPRHLVYLGDAIVLAFIPEALAAHGGEPVLLEAEVERQALVPDPAYVETVKRLALMGTTGYGSNVVDSLRWSGRVATAGTVRIRQRLICRRTASLKLNIERASLRPLATQWYDDSIWRRAAAARGARSVSSAQEWRARVERLVPQLFETY